MTKRTNRLTIVGLGGSMAKISRSCSALISALEGASGAGAETELLNIRDLDLPMYNPDDDQPAAAALVDVYRHHLGLQKEFILQAATSGLAQAPLRSSRMRAEPHACADGTDR